MTEEKSPLGTKNKMDFEPDVNRGLRNNERFGRYQLLMFTILAIYICAPCPWQMFTIVFIGADLPHHCKLPENSTINDSIPLVVGASGELELSRCSMYADPESHNSTIVPCQHGWTYYKETDLTQTINMEWDLVCDQATLVGTTQLVFTAGVLVGALVFTSLADNIGRKPVFLACQFLMAVFGIIIAVQPSFIVFTVFRFFIGMGQQGGDLVGVILAAEQFSMDQRNLIMPSMAIFWGTGVISTSLVGYLLRNWRHSQLFISGVSVLAIPLIWILPESPRWLTVNKKYKKAFHVLERMAKFNGIPLEQEVVDQYTEAIARRQIEKQKENEVFGSMTVKEKLCGGRTNQKAYTIIDIFRSRELRTDAIIVCASWFVNSLVYFGLSLSAGSIAGDRFLNFFILGVVEIPAFIACIFFFKKVGRGRPLCGFHILAGVALLIMNFIPKTTADGASLQGLKLALMVLGKFGISASFSMVFFYTQEIFPTNLRNNGVGLASACAYTAAMIAPFTADISKVFKYFPGVVFGGLSIGVGLICLFLPNTRLRPLPQTLDDIRLWQKQQRANKTSCWQAESRDSCFGGSDDDDHDVHSGLRYTVGDKLAASNEEVLVLNDRLTNV